MKLDELSRQKRQEWLSDRFVHHEYQHSAERKMKRAARKNRWASLFWRNRFAAKRRA